MSDIHTPYKLVEVTEKRCHTVRIEGLNSDAEAKALAERAQGEVVSPYEFEVTAIAVIRSFDGEKFDDE